jgi:hypothetical protein
MAAHRAGASRRRGAGGLGERPKAVSEALRTVAGGMGGGQAVERQGRAGRRSGPAGNALPGAAIGNFNGPLLPWPPATTETRVVGAMVNTQSFLGRIPAPRLSRPNGKNAQIGVIR